MVLCVKLEKDGFEAQQWESYERIVLRLIPDHAVERIVSNIHKI